VRVRIAPVPLGVVEAARVRVADHQRPTCASEHIFDAGGIQVREVDQDPNVLADIYDRPAEGRESVRR
jgi:hypothetical protein